MQGGGTSTASGVANMRQGVRSRRLETRHETIAHPATRSDGQKQSRSRSTVRDRDCSDQHSSSEMPSTALLAALLLKLLLWWLFRRLKLERDISLLYVLFRVKRKQAEYIR